MCIKLHLNAFTPVGPFCIRIGFRPEIADAPVLVVTYITDQSYEVCKTWHKEEWRLFGEEGLPRVFDFSTDKTPRSYRYYNSFGTNAVVIAYFANGDMTIMSDVIRLK